MPLRRSGSETQILNPRTDMDYFLEKEKMSLPRSGSETPIIKTPEDVPNRFDKQSVSYGCDPEIKQMIPDFNHSVKIRSYIGTPDKSPPAEEVGYKSKMEDKQSVFYGCDPEMIHDYNYQPRRPNYSGYVSYSGDVPYKSLLAQELGLECNYRTEDFIFKGNVMIGKKCAICKGKHDVFTCKLRERCPFDTEVGEEFEVVCLCSNQTHCTKRCSYPTGRVTFKKSSSYLDKKSPKYMRF